MREAQLGTPSTPLQRGSLRFCQRPLEVLFVGPCTLLVSEGLQARRDREAGAGPSLWALRSPTLSFSRKILPGVLCYKEEACFLLKEDALLSVMMLGVCAHEWRPDEGIRSLRLGLQAAVSC